MDLIGSAVLGNNDNSNNSESNNSSTINNSNTLNIQNSEDNKSMESVKSESMMPLIDELATVSPSSSTVEQGSSTPESTRIRLTTSPGGTNSGSITEQPSSLPTMIEKAERPSLSYKDLIIEAIESSPEKRLKLNEIYQVCFHSFSLLFLI